MLEPSFTLWSDKCWSKEIWLTIYCLHYGSFNLHSLAFLVLFHSHANGKKKNNAIKFSLRRSFPENVLKWILDFKKFDFNHMQINRNMNPNSCTVCADLFFFFCCALLASTIRLSWYPRTNCLFIKLLVFENPVELLKVFWLCYLFFFVLFFLPWRLCFVAGDNKKFILKLQKFCV